MKKLYKFLSYREGFFEAPKLRLTQRKALNDPFECLPPADQVANLFNRIGDKQIEGAQENGFHRISKEILDSDTAHYKYTNLFDHYGIVSLSQSYESILMWSHYSSQHTGVVIEIDINELALENKIVHSRYDEGNSTKPHPIIYTNDRKLAKNNGTTFNHLFDSYVVKAEQWSYEKEFRIVANLCDASEVLIGNDALRALQSSEYGYFFDYKLFDNKLTKISLNTNAFSPQPGFPFSDTPKKMRANMLTNAYSLLSDYDSSLFLYEIPKKSITKVILGCCISDKNKNEIISQLNAYSNSVEVIFSVRDKNRFELNFNS